MGIQACGVPKESAARNLARNSFVSNFLRCLKVTKEDIKDAFKSLERRLKNDIVVKLHIKDMVLACHHWVETCFWLNVDPELVPFPKDDADAVLEKSKVHDQFVADASDNTTTCEPELFTKDNEWDKWAKTSEDHLSSIPGSQPSSHVICNNEQPQLLPHATDKENFISVASLTRKTFEDNSEKVHTCL